MKIIFTLSVLVAISGALELEKDKSFVTNLISQHFEFENLTGTFEGAIFLKSLSRFTKTKNLIIKNSRVDQIEDGALCSSPFEDLHILNSTLPELTGAMFGTCPSLKKLKITKISSNSSIFSEDVFKGLSNLEEMEILNVKSEDRLPNIRNLTKLRLLKFDVASIQNIEEDAFEGTTNLEELSFKQNAFVELDGKFLKNLKNLKYLDISVCCLNMTEFPWNDLVNVPNLTELAINGIKVRQIEAEKLLRFCPNLKMFEFWGGISCEVVREAVDIIREEEKPDLELLYDPDCI